MPRTTVQCQHCGQDQTTSQPKTRKWCDTCRALKAVKAFGRFAHRCELCEKPYYRRSRPHRDEFQMCSACLEPGASHSDTVRCALCDQDRQGIGGTVRLCRVCAESGDKDQHLRVVRLVVKELARRAGLKGAPDA